MTRTHPPQLWLRAESKPGEARAALAPPHAKMLIDRGFSVVVEDCRQRVFPISDYEAAGCAIAATGEWPAAPANSFILGLKELPDDGSMLSHTHIYFAHAFKEQAGWTELLGRFAAGEGCLLDLEYLVDGDGRRLAAFGHWAGFTGAALGVLNWSRQRRGLTPGLPALAPWPDSIALVAECREALREAAATGGPAPTMIIIGAGGRVGGGALRLAAELDLPATEWDIAETAAGGPFPALLDYDILVNCVLVHDPMPPFLTQQMTGLDGRRLGVIADVSCDPYGSYNPLPLYQRCTTLQDPCLRLIERAPPLDVIAIDHLPSLLPGESSLDFSEQLLPSLLRLQHPEGEEWQRARTLFHERLETSQGGG